MLCVYLKSKCYEGIVFELVVDYVGFDSRVGLGGCRSLYMNLLNSRGGEGISWCLVGIIGCW